MKIYLAGSVPKGNEEAKNFDNWRAKYQEILQKHFKAIFVDPYNRSLDESDFLLVFGADCNHVKTSDLIIVNAETRMGVGTAQEMVIAKYFKKPVVTVLPKNTHHRRSNVVFGSRDVQDWIHPFLHTLSDFVIEKIEDIENIKDKVFSEVKTITVIDKGIEHFLKSCK